MIILRETVVKNDASQRTGCQCSVFRAGDVRGTTSFSRTSVPSVGVSGSGGRSLLCNPDEQIRSFPNGRSDARQQRVQPAERNHGDE